MTLQQLKYVIEVAERGSITEAAKALFIAQPSLSAAIHDLEEETATTIFVRKSRGVLITPEGAEFLGYARQVVQQAVSQSPMLVKLLPLQVGAYLLLTLHN